jgi:hypothetical protein
MEISQAVKLLLEHHMILKFLQFVDNFIQIYFPNCQSEPKCYIYFLFHHGLFFLILVR